MQKDLITVKPHPSNPEGWSVYRNEKMAQLINPNFFMEKENAETVATMLRFSQFRTTLSQLTKTEIV